MYETAAQSRVYSASSDRLSGTWNSKFLRSANLVDRSVIAPELPARQETTTLQLKAQKDFHHDVFRWDSSRSVSPPKAHLLTWINSSKIPLADPHSLHLLIKSKPTSISPLC